VHKLVFAKVTYLNQLATFFNGKSISRKYMQTSVQKSYSNRIDKRHYHDLMAYFL